MNDQIARTVIAATVDGQVADENGTITPRPTVILDDGSVYTLQGDGEWRARRPVPGTVAGLEWKRILDEKRAEDIEE